MNKISEIYVPYPPMSTSVDIVYFLKKTRLYLYRSINSISMLDRIQIINHFVKISYEITLGGKGLMF